MVNSSFPMGNENEDENDAPEFRGRCEDAPCCGCCGQVEYEQYDPEMDEMRNFDYEEPGDNMTDGEADADALASAGFGTDEDYGGEDSHLDSFWESQTECDFGGGDF
jgi:hypothetical protein